MTEEPCPAAITYQREGQWYWIPCDEPGADHDIHRFPSEGKQGPFDEQPEVEGREMIHDSDRLYRTFTPR